MSSILIICNVTKLPHGLQRTSIIISPGYLGNFETINSSTYGVYVVHFEYEKSFSSLKKIIYVQKMKNKTKT